MAKSEQEWISTRNSWSVLLIAFLLVPYPRPAEISASQPSSVEQSVVNLVNGSTAYSYASTLENIALAYPSFRSAGSAGANASALWIASQFESYGLQARLESFPFKTWNLKDKPRLTVDVDGSQLTTDDQEEIASFQSEHYAWPTPEQGVFADLVVLPLPMATSEGDLGRTPIDTQAWSGVNTTGKIVLISNYVLRIDSWHHQFISKITLQRPRAIVYDTYYDWSPEALYPGTIFLRSAGGRPAFDPEGLYWNLAVPTGAVSYADGLKMRELETRGNVSANIAIPAEVADGTHLNVEARLTGESQPDKLVLVTAHYDSVLTPGFGDNAAGVGGVLELARVLTEAKRSGLYAPAYTIVFVAFTAEELWLVGSANYLQTHKGEANQIIAVLNLDVIGSTDLVMTRTDSAGDFDLDMVMRGAASDLGVPFRMEVLGSDQESFRVPSNIADQISAIWQADVHITDSPPIESSALFISSPYAFRQTPRGWIHTSYDNSSSTANFGWITSSKLEEQIKVAALSVLRVKSPTATPTMTIITVVLMAVLAVTLVIIARYVYKRKRRTVLPSASLQPNATAMRNTQTNP